MTHLAPAQHTLIAGRPLRFWIKSTLALLAIGFTLSMMVFAAGYSQVSKERSRIEQETKRAFPGVDIGDSVTIDTTGLSEEEADRKMDEAIEKMANQGFEGP